VTLVVLSNHIANFYSLLHFFAKKVRLLLFADWILDFFVLLIIEENILRVFTVWLQGFFLQLQVFNACVFLQYCFLQLFNF
jgi:hypothetical protein